MMISQKIRIYPNEEQKKYLRDRFSYARYCWNQMLGYTQDLMNKKEKFNRFLIRDWKKANKEEWESEYSNVIIDAVSENFWNSMIRFFNKTSKFPKFKSKKCHKQSFSIGRRSDNTCRIKDFKIKIDKNHWIKLSEDLKYSNPKRFTFSEVSGRFYVSICFDDYNHVNCNTTRQKCGIDVGIKSNVTLADSQGNVKYFDLNKDKLNYIEAKIKFYQRQLSHKKKDSNQYNLTKAKLNNLWFKYNNQIDDFIHKTSHEIVKNYDFIGLETLNVKGMFKNRHLSHSLQRSSISKMINFLIQKAESNGCEVVKIDKFYPSSQICSKCGKRHAEMKNLSKRIFSCECGLALDRDENAAINILNESLKVESGIK